MRIEFVITSWIGQHPLYLMSIGQEHKFVTKMAEGVAKVASAIYPRPVVVRFSDFKTNEYRGLEGARSSSQRSGTQCWGGAASRDTSRLSMKKRLD